MENTNILTEDIVTEAAEDIVMESGLGTGGKVFLGLVAAAGAAFAGYKIYKKIKNKKETVEVVEAEEGEVTEEK